MRKLATDRTKVLTEDQIEKLKYNARGILANARKTVLDRFPFVGTVAMGLDLVPVRDTEVTTMATDGAAIYCDIDFLSRLSNDDKIFILAHEVYHNVMLHPIRRGSRDPELFNISNDMEVNDILRADGLSVPKDAVLPDKFGFPTGKCSEEYYELLIQRQQLQQAKSSSSAKSGAGSFNGSGDGNDSSDGDNDNDSDESSESSAAKSGKSKSKVKKPVHNPNGELAGQFDKHIFKDDPAPSEDDALDPEDSDVADSFGKVGHDPDYRPNVTESACERIRESAVMAATMMAQRGELPGHLQRLVKELLEPKLDWKEVLAKFVTKAGGDTKRTWNKCNRRFVSQKTYLPSSYNDAMKVGVVLDTSGSVVQVADKFLSEVNGIVSAFTGYSLDLIQCDVRVTSHMHFDEYEPLNLAEMKYDINGGGGTRLMPGLKWFKENECDIDCIVVFTDCECEQMTPENAPEVPVLWISTKKGEHKNIQFGEIVDFDPAD